MTQEQKAERNRDLVRRIRGELRLLRVDCAVRVEGKHDLDEIFWSRILRKNLPNLSFKVYRYANYPIEPAFGKANVLKFKEFAARDFILCVDSDYDYLLGKENLIHPFVFQTYLYSVENYQCYATNLLPILKKHLDEETVDFDFVDLMERYSSIVHRLLVYSLFSMHKDGEFNAEKCGDEIGFQMVKDRELSLQKLAQNIENQCLIYAERYENLEEFSDFKLRISDLGLTEKNAYLFLRGHDILERVVQKFLEGIAKPLKNTKFKRKKTEEGSEGAAEYQEYLRHNNIEFLLKKNTNYSDCSFYQKIENDLRTAFQNQ